MERDEDVLEYYDQPAHIPLRYRAASGRHTTQWHTPDFFVLRQGSAGWEEWEPLPALDGLYSCRPLHLPRHPRRPPNSPIPPRRQESISSISRATKGHPRSWKKLGPGSVWLITTATVTWTFTSSTAGTSTVGASPFATRFTTTTEMPPLRTSPRKPASPAMPTAWAAFGVITITTAIRTCLWPIRVAMH